MSEQNPNFVQRQRDAELAYNLQLVDQAEAALKELRERLTSDIPAYRRTAESHMDAASRKMLHDVEENVWELCLDITHHHSTGIWEKVDRKA